MEVDYRVNAEIDPVQLQGLLEQTDWARGRSASDLETMLRHTFVHLSAWRGERLVGFARAVTDTVYRAVIDDVVVDAEQRGQGIGTELLRRLGEELGDVEEVFLGCDTKVVSFYVRLGYRQAQNPFMKLQAPTSEAGS